MNVTLTMASVVTSVRIPWEVTNVDAPNRSTWIQQIRELVEVSNEGNDPHFVLHQELTSPAYYCFRSILCSSQMIRSLYVSGKLPTYPSPKPILKLTFHLGQNVGLGEGHPQNGPGARFSKVSATFWPQKQILKSKPVE